MTQEQKASRTGLVVAAVIYGLAFLLLVCHLVLKLADSDEQAVAVSWSIFLVAALAGFVVTCLLLIRYLGNLHFHSVSLVAELRRLVSGQKHSEALLTQISENLLLSDAIKSVAFRQKDRNVLQQAIQQDIRREQWNTAEMLINELEKRFGCRAEAQQLREELARYRNASVREKIDSSIKNIESLWIIHHYEEAQSEVDNLMRLYPDDEFVRNLQGRTEQRREEHKKELLDRWDKAVKNNDVEQGVEILTLLDNYLSPSEAAALEESARGVFRHKLHNMGVQFSLFVTGQNWNKALNIGRKIIDEYPNSRMAQEVREKLDILEKRAQQVAINQPARELPSL